MWPSSRRDILARVLSVLAFTIASTWMPSPVRAQDEASGGSLIDPAAAVLTPSDLGDGWVVTREDRFEQGGVRGYTLLLFQRDEARFRTARLVAVTTDVRIVGVPLGPGAVGNRLAARTRSYVNSYRQRGETATDPVVIEGPQVGEETQWNRFTFTSLATPYEMRIVGFRVGDGIALVQTQAFLESSTVEDTAILARIVADRLALLQGLAPASGVQPTPAAPLGETRQPPQTGDSPGSVVLADDFDNLALGQLPRSLASPAMEVGYVDGEYAVRFKGLELGQGSARVPIGIPGTYANALLAVDVRLVGDPAGQRVFLACRRQAASGAAYFVYLDAETQTFELEVPFLLQDFPQLMGTGFRQLGREPSSAMRGGNELNRVELSCVGSTISVTINGTVVASIEDSTYSEGELGIGLESAASTTGEARFDNLVVTQR